MEEDIDVTFTVTDADGDKASRDFQISVVVGNTVPQFPTQMSIPDQTAREESHFELDLPLTTGGNSPIIYTVTGAADRPADYVKTDTSIIAGIPEAGTANTYPITYTVTDVDQEKAELTFNIVVEQDHKTQPPRMSPITLQRSPSNSAKSCHLEAAAMSRTRIRLPPLPAGLTFNKDTRYIEGTPTISRSYDRNRHLYG